MKGKIIIKCLNIRRIRCLLEWGQSQQITCIDNTTVHVIRIHFDITQSSEVDIHTLQTKHLKIKSPKNLKTKESVDRFGHVPKYAYICIHIYLIFYECFYIPLKPFFWNKLINRQFLLILLSTSATHAQRRRFGPFDGPHCVDPMSKTQLTLRGILTPSNWRKVNTGITQMNLIHIVSAMNLQVRCVQSPSIFIRTE